MPDHGSLDALCRGFPHVVAGSPFGPDSVVYKVGGKMFAVLSLDSPRINLKCHPARATLLRERHPAVEPGYHMSKVHWNSIYWEREPLRDAELQAWISHSYALIFASLSAKLRATLPGGTTVADPFVPFDAL